jgi:hypothetical protein
MEHKLMTACPVTPVLASHLTGEYSPRPGSPPTSDLICSAFLLPELLK